MFFYLEQYSYILNKTMEIDFRPDSYNCIMIGLIVSLVIYILFFMAPKQSEAFTIGSVRDKAMQLAEEAIAKAKTMYKQNTKSGFNTMPLDQVQALLTKNEGSLAYILDKTGSATLPVTATSEKILFDGRGIIPYNISYNYPLVPEIARKQASKLIASLPTNDPMIGQIIELLAAIHHGRQLINKA